MLPGLNLLRTDDLPRMARPNYLRELRHILLWSVFANLVDGTFSSIVVAKTFHGSSTLVSFVWATPMLAHMSSLAWGIFVRGRRRVQMFVLLAGCAAACAASVAFTPRTESALGGWIFGCQIALARIFLSGLVTVRTAMWAANYPSTHRARIAGRIQMLSAILMLVTAASITTLFDRHAEFYRFVYPVIALVGLCSLIPLSRIRVRGEAREMSRTRAHLAANGEGNTSRWRMFVSGVNEARTILRENRPFARYCTAQYFLGSSNFMVDPVLTLILAKQLGYGYFVTSLILEQIPTAVSILTLQRWSHLFDRVGVLRFRVINSAIWLASVVLATAAVFALGAPGLLPAAIGLLVASRLVNGAGRGGGSIAWNLGHLHFADEHQAELYMGIHVALTGMRGLIMPFVGAWTYQWLGAWSFLIAIASAVAAQALFRRLWIDARRVERPAEQVEGSLPGDRYPAAAAVGAASDSIDLA